MGKQINILMTFEDEKDFSLEIKREFPAVGFIDDVYWPTNNIPVRKSIPECKSKFVFIWNQEIYKDIPRIQRPDGSFVGPQSGVVIQMIKSTFDDPTSILPPNSVLSSGRLAFGSLEDENTDKMKDFVSKIWKILGKITTRKLSNRQIDRRKAEYDSCGKECSRVV